MKQFLFALIFILIIAFVLHFGTQKENKEELAKFYNVTKPTLNKWVLYFPCSMTPDKWKRKRKLTLFESTAIKSHWGSNADLVMKKYQLADAGSACYKTLTKCVMDNLENIGITEEAWNNCSVFPPIICERIIKLLQGKSSEENLLQSLILATNY